MIETDGKGFHQIRKDQLWLTLFVIVINYLCYTIDVIVDEIRIHGDSVLSFLFFQSLKGKRRYTGVPPFYFLVGHNCVGRF